MGQEADSTIWQAVAFDLACRVSTPVRYHISKPWRQRQRRSKSVHSRQEQVDDCEGKDSQEAWTRKLHRAWVEEANGAVLGFGIDGGAQEDVEKMCYAF